MKASVIIIWLLCSFACGSSNNGNKLAASDSIKTSIEGIDKSREKLLISSGDMSILRKTDKLNAAETQFLEKISEQNEFVLLSPYAERIVSEEDELLLTNVLVSAEHYKSRGYLTYEMKFVGEISNVNLSYTYNLGKGAYGFGAVVGFDTHNFVHTFTSCGVTSCILRVYQTDSLVLEKVSE